MLLTDALTQGRGARELADLLTVQINVEYANAARLLRTEIARVQTAVQKDSFEKAGFEYFVFIALESGCSICKKLDTEHTHDAEPIPVKDMMPGVNAPPMHPNCRCSTAAYISRELFLEQTEKKIKEVVDKSEKILYYIYPAKKTIQRRIKRTVREIGC